MRNEPERQPWEEPDGFSGREPEEFPGQEAEKKAGRAAILLPLAICAALLAVLLAEGLFFWWKGAQLEQRNAVYVPDAVQSIHPADESFAFGPRQRAVKVSGQGQELEEAEGVPADKKLVRAAVSLGAMNQDAWDCAGAFYLQCDGVYYASVSGYQLEQDHPEWAMRALDDYALCERGMEEGWVYFLVPDTVQEATVWLHWLEKDTDYHTESVEAAGVPVQFVQEVTGDD